eukprot:155340-Chlamydomonas_euryale.AAC.6
MDCMRPARTGLPEGAGARGGGGEGPRSGWDGECGASRSAPGDEPASRALLSVDWCASVSERAGTAAGNPWLASRRLVASERLRMNRAFGAEIWSLASEVAAKSRCVPLPVPHSRAPKRCRHATRVGCLPCRNWRATSSLRTRPTRECIRHSSCATSLQSPSGACVSVQQPPPPGGGFSLARHGNERVGRKTTTGTRPGEKGWAA